MTDDRLLLAIHELGGYPNFNPLYRRLGFEVETTTSVRKAIALLKKRQPRIIVAEFNYQHTFRDRISNLESLLAVLQRLPGINVVAFYEPDHEEQLARIRERFPISAALPFPIDETRLARTLRSLPGEADSE
jgi:hypothetical protein